MPNFDRDDLLLLAEIVEAAPKNARILRRCHAHSDCNGMNLLDGQMLRLGLLLLWGMTVRIMLAPKMKRDVLRAIVGKLASLNRSWQSNKGTYRASGLAGIEPMPSESE